MSKRRPYFGPSDAQANADALSRRGLPYTAANQATFAIRWQWDKREPRDLREAVRMARKAYADEVPTKLHDSDIGEDGTPRMSARAEGYIFGNPQASDAPVGKCTCPANRAFWTSDRPASRAECDEARPILEELTRCELFDPVVVGKRTWSATGLDPHLPDCPRHPKNITFVSYYLAPFRATLAGMERGDEASRKRAAIVAHVTIGSQGPKEAAEAEGVPSWCAGLVAFDALAAFLRRLTDVKLDIGKEAVA